MIDFIKIEIVDPKIVVKIRNNSLLEFENEIHKPNITTGEIFYIVNLNYTNLKFKFVENNDRVAKKLLISGSLHYLFNDGFHNSNDFSYMQGVQAIQELQSLFEIDPAKSILRSLEFGVNIKPGPYSSRQILQNTFYHGRKKFKDPLDKPYKQAGNLRSNDYILKLYDKAYQFPEYVDNETLRFEIKFGRMRSLNNANIKYLSDLINYESYIKLSENLWKRFSEILMFDYSIRKNELSTQNKKSFLKYQNPNFWESLILEIKRNQNKRNLFYYHKKMLQRIASNHSDQIQDLLLHTIKLKCIELLHLSSFYGPEKTLSMSPNIMYENNSCMAPAPLFIG